MPIERFVRDAALTPTIEQVIAGQKAQPNGLAPLDLDGDVPAAHVDLAKIGASPAGHGHAYGDLANRPFVSVKDYGAVGDGATDDRAAIQAALDASLHVFIPPGNYLINGALSLRDFQVLRGAGLYGNSDGNQATGATKLLFTGTAGACITQADTTTAFLHAGMSDMTIRATGTYSWIFDFKTLVGWKMTSMRSETSSTTCGGFRSQKINATDSSWVVNWWDVQWRLPDASTARTIDTDFSDATIAAGSSSGGKGAIFRGAGGVKFLGVRFDRSSDTGLTFSIEHESKTPYIVDACEIEENSINGILFDGDAFDARVETWVQSVISNNYFRNHVAGAADIRFKNDTGPVLRGGVISGNSHLTGAVPIARDRLRWTDVTINSGNVNGKAAPHNYFGARYLQSSLVLAQSAVPVSHTGDLLETTLATIEVPGDAIGPNGTLRITTLWSGTVSANQKTLRVKYGGTAFLATALGSNMGTGRFYTDISNRNSPTSQIGAPAAWATGFGSNANPPLTAALNTRIALNLTITGQLATATETVTLEYYKIELLPG